VIPQLIRVVDDTHVWAQTYDRDMSDVFACSPESLSRSRDSWMWRCSKLNAGDGEEATENLAAYEDYMRGMDHSRMGT